MNQKLALIFIIILILSISIEAATLKGSIYNTNLNTESNVLMEINTIPAQKYFAKEGTYSFDIPTGKYLLTATKDTLETKENIEIVKDGIFVYDIFLTQNLADEEELWNETNNNYLPPTELIEENTNWWSYLIAGIIFLIAIYRVYKARKKYGPLNLFRKKIKTESKKTEEEIKQELLNDPSSIDKALEIIKKHEGRISQKELRKEMLYLSEAKVSLILTELEHKQKIEKIKKGRGNVIILKNE